MTNGVIEMGARKFDPEGMVSLAGELMRAGNAVDRSAETAPETIDAGPFTPWIVDMINAVGANAANLTLRLTAASEAIAGAAERYRITEDGATTSLEAIERDPSLLDASEVGR